MRGFAATALALLGLAGAAEAATPTDFGVRAIGSAPVSAGPADPAAYRPLVSGRSVDMGEIKRIGAQWGRVTSTYRSPEHNRRVGGVANSYHLRGRAIDVARRPGVSHAQLAAAFRAAGYHLVESLDEIDHSHFAFGSGSVRVTNVGGGSGSLMGPRPTMVAEKNGDQTVFRMVYAPSGNGR